MYVLILHIISIGVWGNIGGPSQIFGLSTSLFYPAQTRNPQYSAVQCMVHKTYVEQENIHKYKGFGPI